MLVRSVITQAARGGRCVVPRRYFSSPSVSQVVDVKQAGERIVLAGEANGAGGRVRKNPLEEDPLVYGGCFLGGGLVYMASEFLEIRSLLLKESEVKKKLVGSQIGVPHYD
ncbi:unnamed protein product [Microthlaspi erraticum]|uniref:Uncharacterized protein n=1 Tax=Microthlaspi erraticum TaxID=1685480 RepID=A0A6D2L9G3_9BRAS|nr:unnamed protein product [Microthlaspi erraticum]